MNLLENYIVEVVSVKPCNEEWVNEFPDRDFLEVVAIFNCYGRKREERHIFSTCQWESIKEKGYYMG